MNRFYCKHCKSIISPGFPISDTRSNGTLMFDHFCPFCDYLLTGVPNFETPEQWEKRTGEKWKGAVYFNLFSRKDGKSLYTDGRYQVSSTGEIIETIDRVMGLLGFPDCVVVVVCATEAGPPPDGWKPEEE